MVFAAYFYQDVDFLDFLRSGERDVEAFAARSRKHPSRGTRVENIRGTTHSEASVNLADLQDDTFRLTRLIAVINVSLFSNSEKSFPAFLSINVRSALLICVWYGAAFGLLDCSLKN